MTEAVILLILGSLVLLWGVILFNQLVRRRNLVLEGWSGIDVQLKRRANLIPNLIETVKGYMGHERELLSRLAELRARSIAAGEPGERGPLEGALSQTLGRLFAIAEAYPALKADGVYRELQKDLVEIEEQIQLARRYYNGATRELNIAVESFPSNLVARLFGFGRAEFFEIEDAAERAVPAVGFQPQPRWEPEP